MFKKVIYIVFVLFLILTTAFFPTLSAESNKKNDKIKDKDKDGVPDHLDNPFSNSSDEEPGNVSEMFRSPASAMFSGGNWSFDYGSDIIYGAWIANVYWNNTLFIGKANVPWIKIDGVRYLIPEDFTEHGTNTSNHSSYYQAYQLYSINISGIQHDVEVLWKFYKATVNSTGKINVTVQHSAHDTNSHTLNAVFRINFDIDGEESDEFKVFGGSGWGPQCTESFQFTYTPVDPTWGMKVKLEDMDDNMNTRWGGIKAWSTSEKNYLLLYNENEFKGTPSGYVSGEDIANQDNVVWTTASSSGSTALKCGPTLFLY
jgi:hypothetical protein